MLEPAAALLISWYLSVALSANALAQDNSPPLQGANVVLASGWPHVEVWLAGAIIAFGLVVLGMQFSLIRGMAEAEPEDSLRLFTVTMIIVGTLALIAIGYSGNQIAPALGLFGTIIGYLLGKTDERIRLRRGGRKGGGVSERSDHVESASNGDG